MKTKKIGAKHEVEENEGFVRSGGTRGKPAIIEMTSKSDMFVGNKWLIAHSELNVVFLERKTPGSVSHSRFKASPSGAEAR